MSASNDARLQHCLGVNDLSESTILTILDHAKQFFDADTLNLKPKPLLTNKVVCLAFFEASTRTKLSTELAAKHLGATVIDFDADSSSLQKGETLIDTVETLLAIGVNCLVIRDKREGFPLQIAEWIGPRAHLLNAGDGSREHPTQALLDMLTIQQFGKSFSGLSVAIVGDIKHSRVARSQFQALQKLGVKDIRLVAPDAFQPEGDVWQGAARTESLDESLDGVDVVIALRIQHERIQATQELNTTEFFNTYGLTPERLALAKPDAIVMHPGPMNRGVEIASDVADGPQSACLAQVRLGVALRMSLLDLMMGKQD